MIERKILILGPLAFLSFVLSFLAFAAIQPGYSHTRNMISELGMAGAPNALAWNWIGFGFTGLLALVFAWGLRAALLPERGATAVAILVAIAGLAVPKWRSLSSQAFAGTIGSILGFAVALGVTYALCLALPAVGFVIGMIVVPTAAIFGYAQGMGFALQRQAPAVAGVTGK